MSFCVVWKTFQNKDRGLLPKYNHSRILPLPNPSSHPSLSSLIPSSPVSPTSTTNLPSFLA